ncbi:MAG: hypothetical protein ABGW97_16005 [Christiangramia sp.]|uniref:hypothetical protein n=1 Tax=Christiangramia sp. TaxID=1931228 RepID=UPI00324262B5
MKKKLSIKNLILNLIIALLFAYAVGPFLELPALPVAGAIVVVSSVSSYFFGDIFKDSVLFALQTEIWVPDIKENPVPDHSFVNASTDMSEYVENNKIHLAEAGIEPAVYEDYFSGNENELPVADIQDIPSEVVLKTYSTEQTRHRDLQELELQYNKRQSVINRHRTSLAKNLGKRASFEWTPSADGSGNKLMILGAGDSLIDAIIDMELFYAQNDKTDNLNICLSPEHMAQIRKEDKDLYKQIKAEKGLKLYGFNIYSYSQNPLFDSTNAKKPYGSAMVAGDKRCSFTWATDEVFRCFGDVQMYATLKDAGLQADILSFAQRALVGKIRANSPKYLGAII